MAWYEIKATRSPSVQRYHAELELQRMVRPEGSAFGTGVPDGEPFTLSIDVEFDVESLVKSWGLRAFTNARRSASIQGGLVKIAASYPRGGSK